MPTEREVLESFAARIDSHGDATAARRRGDKLRRRRRLLTSLGACVLVLAMVGGIAIIGDRATDNSQTHIVDTPADPYTDLGVGPWEQLAAPPVPVDQGTAIVRFNADLIVWGSNGGREGAAFERDTSDDEEWRVLPPAPAELGTGPATAVATETTIILVTGDPHIDDARAAVFKPASGTWEMLANPPFRRGESMTVGWTGTEALFYGVGTGECVAPQQGYAYNPSTDAWRTLPDPPFGTRAWAVSVWTGPSMNVSPNHGQLVVLGGSQKQCASDPESPRHDGAAYDPVTDSWTALPEDPGGRPLWAEALQRGVVVGDDRCGMECTSTMLLDPTTGEWHDLGDTGPNARQVLRGPHQVGLAFWHGTEGSLLIPERGWSELPNLPADLAADLDALRMVSGPRVMIFGGNQFWRYPGDAYLAKTREPVMAMDSLSVYARYPQMFSLDDVPLGDDITFAFGDQVVGTRTRSDLAEDGAWHFDFPDDTIDGSFSVLDILRSDRQRWVVAGPGEAECASSPPPGAEALRRAGVVGDLSGPCEDWWSVDFFVDRDGRIQMIRYDLWQP